MESVQERAENETDRQGVDWAAVRSRGSCSFDEDIARQKTWISPVLCSRAPAHALRNATYTLTHSCIKRKKN